MLNFRNTAKVIIQLLKGMLSIVVVMGIMGHVAGYLLFTIIAAGDAYSDEIRIARSYGFAKCFDIDGKTFCYNELIDDEKGVVRVCDVNKIRSVEFIKNAINASIYKPSLEPTLGIVLKRYFHFEWRGWPLWEKLWYPVEATGSCIQ